MWSPYNHNNQAKDSAVHQNQDSVLSRLEKRIEPAFRWRSSILVGNGLNRVYGAPGWAELMGSLKASRRVVNSDAQQKFVFDPQPAKIRDRHNGIPHVLTYQAFVETSGGEFKLQNKVAEAMRNLSPGNLHRQLVAIRANVLTTNFDMTLERSVADAAVYNHRTFKDQRRGAHLLFQFQQIVNKAIWHIHGNIQETEQLVLGISAYSIHLRRIHSYLYDYEATHDDGLGSRSPYALAYNRGGTPQKPQLPRSWVDLVIGTDLHIIGLDLDFMEFHLWWLLSKKSVLAKILIRKQGGPIVGKTSFYDIIVNEDSFNVARQNALQLFGVQVVPISAKSFADGYADALNRIARNCHEI